MAQKKRAEAAKLPPVHKMSGKAFPTWCPGQGLVYGDGNTFVQLKGDPEKYTVGWSEEKDWFCVFGETGRKVLCDGFATEDQARNWLKQELSRTIRQRHRLEAA